MSEPISIATDKVEQSLYFPETIQNQALRTDRAMSYIVQQAWKQKSAEISAMSEDAVREVVSRHVPEGIDSRKQNLYFPRPMLEEIEQLSIQLDMPLSRIVQAAFVLARPEIEKIPTVDQIPA